MRRSPQDIIYTISHALKEGKKGDEYLIAELAKRIEMHYVTVSNYLTMIEYIHSNTPKFSTIYQKGNSKIIISEELEMDISDEERLLLTLFDRGAFGKSTSVRSEQFDGDALRISIKNGDVLRAGSHIHLSKNGIMRAADIADEREGKVLCTPIKAYGEFLIEREVERWKYEAKEKTSLFASLQTETGLPNEELFSLKKTPYSQTMIKTGAC